MNGTIVPAAAIAAASTLGQWCRERHPKEETADWEDPPRTRRSSAPLPRQPPALSKHRLVWTQLVWGYCRRWFCHDGLGETSQRHWLMFVNIWVVILVPEEEESVANSNERTSSRSKRMTDNIAFLIDCVRKGCIFLLEKELHTATQYQVIHLHERVRGRGSLFSGCFYPKCRDNWVSHCSWDSHCALCHCYIVWVGMWGERQVCWVPWDSSVVSEQTSGTLWSLLLCWDLCPCPTPLIPF